MTTEQSHTIDLSFISEVSERVRDLAAVSEEEIMSLTFETADEGCNFFTSYAMIKGFNVRKQDQRRRRNGDIVMHKWVCSRSGRNPDKRDTPGTSRRTSTARVGCSTQFRINLIYEGRWEVGALCLHHNHELVPSALTCFMTANRGLTEGDKSNIASMLKAGIRQCDIMRFLAHMAGGLPRVGFTIRDMYNHGSKDLRNPSSCSDFDAAMAYLMGKRREDPGMALATHVDNGIVTRCYWADSRSRMDYHYFGDVVAFDSTYRTNAYNLQMVPVVGVNHHHQTIVFGCALITDETVDSYCWVLRTHTDVMGGKTPVSVVTDADKAIISSVRTVWTDSKHRLCIWHFQRNIAKHIAAPSVRSELFSIMFSTEAVEEVEHRWQSFRERHTNLSSRWIAYLDDTRNMWLECHLRGNFWAEMRSTQRCERMHAYMKGYLRNSCRLHEFLHHFDRAMADLRHKEMQEDYDSGHKKPMIVTVLKKLEENGAMLYTHQSFRRFQNQLMKEALFYVVGSSSGNVQRTYELREYDNDVPSLTVFSTIGFPEITCSCGHYEGTGIPCAHSLHVAKIEGWKFIPDNLVKRRWSKSAKSGADNVMAYFGAYGVSVDECRQGALIASCQRMCYWGSRSSHAFTMLSGKILELSKTMEDMVSGGETGKTGRRKRKPVTITANSPVADFGKLKFSVGQTLCVGNESRSPSYDHADDRSGIASVLGACME